MSLFYNILAGRSIEEFVLPHDMPNDLGGKKKESQTKSAYLYKFESKNGIEVDVLDTPGLADTRGIGQDDLHKKNIATEIREEVETVTAVLLLTNGTVERLSVATDYALSSLSSLFPRTLADNIGIMFTCVSGPLSRNFELDSLPNALQRKQQFHLDNPLAKWKKLNAILAQTRISDSELADSKQEVEECHNKALKALALLFDWLDTLTPQPTNDIADLFERYQQIDLNIVNALSRASQLADKKAELTNIQKSIESNKIVGSINISCVILTPSKIMEECSRIATKKFKVWEQVNTTQHNTICRYPECRSNCHVGCKLPFSLDPDTVMQECFAMTDSGCRRCGHSLMEHHHYRSLWKKRTQTQKVVLKGSEQEYNDAAEKNSEYENTIVNLGKSIADIDAESEDLFASLRHLTESYAALSLTGSFIGHVKKTKKYLETNLEIMRRNKYADPRVKEFVEKSLDDVNRKLIILQQVDKGDRVSGRGTAGGNVKRIGGRIKGGVKSAVRGAVSGMQAFSTAFKPNSKSRPMAARGTEGGL